MYKVFCNLANQTIAFLKIKNLSDRGNGSWFPYSCSRNTRLTKQNYCIQLQKCEVIDKNEFIQCLFGVMKVDV